MPEPGTHLVPPDGPTPSQPNSTGVGPAAVNRRLVVFDPATGLPVVKTIAQFTKTQIADLAMAVAGLPYTTPEDELAVELGLPPSRFYGMTNLEVMLIRRQERAAQTGDRDEVEAVLDRLIGKPLAKSESARVNVSYEDFLRAAAEDETRRTAAAHPIQNLSPGEWAPPGEEL